MYANFNISVILALFLMTCFSLGMCVTFSCLSGTICLDKGRQVVKEYRFCYLPLKNVEFCSSLFTRGSFVSFPGLFGGSVRAVSELSSL